MNSLPIRGHGAALKALSKPFSIKLFALASTSFVTLLGVGNEAKAQQAIQTTTCSSSLLGGVFTSDCPTSATLGDKKVSNFFPSIPVDQPIPPGIPEFSVRFDYTWLDLDGIADANYADDLWTFKLTSNQSVSGTFGPFTYGYDVEITDPNWEFNALGLDSDVPVLSKQAVVVKDASDPNSLTDILSLTSVNGAPAGPGIFAGTYRKIQIRDTITLTPDPIVELTSVTNAWNQRPSTTKVPSPLPILGAGAAFSMSRRLRQRIKARSVA
jgi:hypothetical protein